MNGGLFIRHPKVPPPLRYPLFTNNNRPIEGIGESHDNNFQGTRNVRDTDADDENVSVIVIKLSASGCRNTVCGF